MAIQRSARRLSLLFAHEPTGKLRQGFASTVIREGISLDLNIKKPGLGMELERAALDFDYQDAFHTPLIEAYELLILEAMEGDHTLFTREDEVERAWEVLMPVLEQPPPVAFYEPGSWGPEEAEALSAPRHWHVTAPPAEGAISPAQTTG